jgi:VCBS repeat-containing protein
MPGCCRSSSGVHLRPHSQAIALETRILFDGAAASAATDQHHTDQNPTPADTALPDPTTPAPPATAAPAAASPVVDLPSPGDTSATRITADAANNGARALAALDAAPSDASPTVTITGAGQDVLLGDPFTFTVNFNNTSGQEGYAPFIALLMPASGKDGNDGASFVSASYLGRSLDAKVAVFDAAGIATSPVAKDSSGQFVTLNAGDFGMNPGDQLVILQLPFASVSADQPAIAVQITARLSNLADTQFSNGAPDLILRASGGFELGNDALDNPTNDPSLIEAATVPFVVHPTVITFSETLDTVEGETATGPNYGHTLTLTATPAEGQSLNNVNISQALPDNVQVTAITPGAGGTLMSITLHDGTLVSNPVSIAALIAADDVFVRDFTVQYNRLTGATDTRVSFYVPEVDANGQQVLDPVSGNPATVTFPGPTGRGDWVPLDARDVVPPATDIDFTGTGPSIAFVAKSITLTKLATLQTDIGQAGLSPGDTLNYALDVAVSDYFAFGSDFFGDGQLVIRDQVGDGQTVSGTPTLSVTLNGVTQSIALLTTSTPNADGSTSLLFDIAGSLRAGLSSVRGWLNGDLAFDDTLEGAVVAVINYSTVVSQRYTPPAGDPHPAINEGDALGNAAALDGTVLQDLFNLSGQSQTDDSATTLVVPTRTLDISLVEVNAAAPPGNGELRPGDDATFQISYDLVTGDYQNFALSAYLPLPLFDVTGISWSTGNAPGQWQLAPGNSNAGSITNVSSGPGNSVLFTFADFSTPITSGSRIAVQFTLRVGDQPFADQRSLDVLGQSSQQTTLTHQTLISSDVAPITSVAEPSLALRQGVVSASAGTVTGTTGTWNLPGTTGVPFAGSVTELASVDGNVVGIDGGDSLRLVTALENSGGGGAFDVSTRVTLPGGLAFIGGSLGTANVQVFRGDGSALIAGTDYSVTGNRIDFLDAGGQATLLAGRAGSTADSSGANVVIISYDVQVISTVAASSTLQTSAMLSHYASVEGGADFTPDDLSDMADHQVAAPVINKVFADGTPDDSDSSAVHTAGSELVVGERMLYDIVVTLPEGSTQTLRIDDLIPPGLRLDTAFNGGLGYQVIVTRTGSAALAADFIGSVVVSGVSGTGGAAGADGVGARLSFASATANADNLTGNNSFVVRVQLVTSNTVGNQSGVVLPNTAQLSFADPDGDTANGTVAIDRVVALSGTPPAVTLAEPTLHISQAVTSVTPPAGFDEGDTFAFTVTLSNGNASTDFSAFDISLQDTLPTQLNNVVIASVDYQNGATPNGGADFEIVNGVLRTVSGANIDIAKGASIVLHLSGVVNATAAGQSSFDNLATVQWTSLDGPAPGERSGVDGPLNSGALNDYQSTSTLTATVAQAMIISRVGGLPDTLASSPTTAAQEQVAIGEVIRYRVVVLIPEGNNPNYQVQVSLANGLQFISPDALSNALRIAFISNGGLSSDANLIVAGTLNVNGNETSPEAQPITADLSGAAPTGVFNPGRIVVVNNADGSQTVTFDLGNVTNGSGGDADLEGVALEFNVRVANQTGIAAGAQLAVSAREFVNGNPRAASDTVLEQVVEPGFSGLNKQVTAFDPNPAGVSGTATIALDFTQNGGLPAFDAQLNDGFVEGSDYALVSVEINGVSYTAATLPAGVGLSTASGLSVSFQQLDVGTIVRVVYQVTLPNHMVIASSDATLTWSSLPEDFTQWGGSAVGTDGNLDGERTGSQIGPNQYALAHAAGLGVITGTLWNDTASADASAAPDGPGLGGQPVTLTWAGTDGLLETGADNLQFDTVTDSNGQYLFGVLPAGVFRIDSPVGPVNYPQPLGDLRVRIDSDGNTLGQVILTLGDAATGAADSGYVEQNDAPANSLPGAQSGREDTLLSIVGISVADPDADRDPVGTDRLMQVSLNVLHGTLSLGSLPGGVTPSGQNTASLQLTGTLADLNSALAVLQYLGNQDYNGSDTLTVTTRDQGNFGDANGDGLPGQAADTLTDTDALPIVLAAVNDPPQANADTALAAEAGGTQNATPGINPIANLLSNDTDVDIATDQDTLTVIRLRAYATGATVNLPNIGASSLQGQFGRLLVSSNGTYQYQVDNANSAVQALRLAGQTLSEQFTYVLRDQFGVQSSAALTVTLTGANDTPAGIDDQGVAVEAGGVFNGTPGSAANGNVLSNDTDVDSAANGEQLSVTGIRAVDEASAGAFASVPVSGNATVSGLYGALSIDASGTYRYVVDDANIAVQRLSAGEQLVEFFSYRVTDVGGLNDVAQLRITVQGANDNPVASDDQADAQAAPTDGRTPEINPVGNVIQLPSRPGPDDQPGGNGVDQDVDTADRPASQLQVNGVAPGTESSLDPAALVAVATGTTSANGTLLTGRYGGLTLGADGSYAYDVDSGNPAVQALTSNDTLTDVFSYRVVDSKGLSDLAQLTITVRGVNDPPVAQTVIDVATEAGGLNNATPGADAIGNVLQSAFDPDGDPLSVTFIRFGDASAGGSEVPVVAGGTGIAGVYGVLTIAPDGSHRYVIDDSNPEVQALRLSSDQLFERFSYTLSDGVQPDPRRDTAQIVIVIRGQNDDPHAVDDSASAIEAGGTFNNAPGVDPTGTLLSNDSDVDAGDSKTLDGIRAGSETAGGALIDVIASQTVRGLYGDLTVNRDGTFRYDVDNSLAAIQALTPGDALVETFTYRQHDTAWASDLAQLTISVQGAWDAPVASDDIAVAVASNGSGIGDGNSVNPTRNVLPNDSDVDQGDSLRVSAIGRGAEASGGPLSEVQPDTDNRNGTQQAGLYGALIIGADGQFTYAVDSNNPAVLALGPLQFLQDTFTYRVTDQGDQSDLAEIRITVRGRNETPVAIPDTGEAIEAGGLDNREPGSNPGGNVIANDTDADGDALQVTALYRGALPGNPAALGVALRGDYGDLTLNGDGRWQYVLDNDLPAVQALRVSGQTLTEVFTYTVTDVWGASSSAPLRITIDGRNDTPSPQDDTATAVEAGGIANTTPGRDATGNVLNNDTDVDSLANGETRQLLSVTGFSGQSVAAGQTLAGRYGVLTAMADGSYRYLIDNDNPTAQALRTAGDTLSERFSYRVRDSAGATADASLTIVIQGANDAPIARDDRALASDQVLAPQASGNVLHAVPGGDSVTGRDTDIDANDDLRVVAVRSGAENASGASGAIGQTLAGRYGSLILNGDGSYRYRIDQTNPQVLAAAGLGTVLTDAFTYTVNDRAGASDQAQLLIDLDIAEPFIPAPDAGSQRTPAVDAGRLLPPDPAPAVFVTPVVEREAQAQAFSTWASNGSQFFLALPAITTSESMGAGLGLVPGQYVADSVHASARDSEKDLARILARPGRTELTADGLLSDPSLFALSAFDMTHNPSHTVPATADADARPSTGFTAQLRAAAQRLPPLNRPTEGQRPR